MNCEKCKNAIPIGDEVATMEISHYYPEYAGGDDTDLFYMEFCQKCADKCNERQERIDAGRPKQDGIENTKLMQDLIRVTEISRKARK